MKLRSIAFLLALACTPAAAAPPGAALLAKVHKIFDDWRLTAHAPGVVYGIVMDGKLVAVEGLGVQDVKSASPVTADSLFRIASMSKAFTALAILKLRDGGKLALDAPAETYIPELKSWSYPTSDSPKITVRNLLTHSAGFVEDNPWGDRQQVMPEEDFTKFLRAGVPLARPPGMAMEYSNLGFAMLGRIVGNVSGIRYQDYIKQQIMVPLGMTSTTYDVLASPAAKRSIGYRWQDNGWVREPDMKDGAFGAMGGVETSANDYARWVSFLLAAWPARDGAESGPVRRATVREIVSGANFVQAGMRNPAIDPAPCRQARGYAMGWFSVDDCDLGLFVTHSGGYPGYGSYVMLMPSKGVGLFALSSRTYGSPEVPVLRAALALKAADALPDREMAVSAGLAAAYSAAKAVWRAVDITAAPLANNMLMDHDAAAWKKLIGDVKTEVGDCPATEPVQPVSAMEGRFSWRCAHGRVEGRVQRAPVPQMAIQRLTYTAATP
ncbi:MAG: beta-lactamase family protein [Alphaproteobacteria bacterium]|nr:beta-lactamase family protein [Alphaproteobacteria bacterium]